MSEIALLKQAQMGDHRAFDDLYSTLQPMIRRFVVRLIGDQPDVDDIVQLTFLALYRNLHRIDPPETLRPYTFKIARHRCIDVLRRQGRYEVLSLDDDEPLQARVSFQHDAQPRPEEAVHWMLVRTEVMAAIDQLPENQRQTLILYAEEGLSLKEIALAMDTAIGTVKSRLHHARHALRARLAPQTRAIIEELFKDHE